MGNGRRGDAASSSNNADAALKKADAASKKAENASKRAEASSKKRGTLRSASHSSIYDDVGNDASNNGSNQGSGSETEREGDHEQKRKKKKKEVAFPTEVPVDASDPEERLTRIENMLNAIHGTLASVSKQEDETAKYMSKLQSDNAGLREMMQNMLPGQTAQPGASPQSVVAAKSVVDKMEEKRAFRQMTGKMKIQRALDKYGLPSVHKDVFNSAVKAQFASLLQLASLRPSDLKEFTAPTTEEAEQVVNQLNFGDPKSYTYCWDEARDFPFNQKARHAFYSHFLTSRKSTNWLTSYQFDDRLIMPETVLESLDACIRTARRHWKVKDTPKVKDVEKEKENRELQRRYTVKDKRSGVSTRPDIQKHAKFTRETPTAAHSDDSSGEESEAKNIPNKQLKARRKYPIWRSLRLSGFFWGLDEIGDELEVAKVQASMCKKKGMPFRIRLPPNSVTHAKAPGNLPINCYSKQFLQTLQPWEKLCLNPLPPYAFPTEVIGHASNLWEKIPTKFRNELALLKDAEMSDITS
ncbi:hypothetical protein SCHPADRAFT_910926 [Schizopora paradoxa]|uniref:Uncharacterized protein n=1 Tax=Schizopora paradoxa TaxID=27342 RepID=A0A0H2R7W0_9AGAM|nr:hypothetical protein SCHPADRAFT_910926 [Schizopora paradoxa]